MGGAKLAERIREVCHGQGPHHLAVAFWGAQMPEILFPQGLHSVEVVLDVVMGGTSKDALHALGVPESASVSVCDGLHTKLYISRDGAVIASANASANALGAGLEGGRLHELGVWIDAKEEPDAYAQAKAEFDRIKRLSRPATQRDIDLSLIHI